MGTIWINASITWVLFLFHGKIGIVKKPTPVPLSLAFQCEASIMVMT